MSKERVKQLEKDFRYIYGVIIKMSTESIVVNRFKGYCVNCSSDQDADTVRASFVDELIDNEKPDWSLTGRTRCSRCSRVYGK